MEFNPYSAANFEAMAGGEQIWEQGSLFSAVLQRSNIRVGVPVFPFLATFTKMTEEIEGERGITVKETGKDVVQVVVQAAILKHLLSA